MNKEKYKALCAEEFSIPIYSRDWWLDCVCGKNQWDVLFYMQGEAIEATMLLYMPYKGILSMPAYAQTLGIWFNPAFENKKYSKNVQRKQTICEYFIHHLPPHHHFHQTFHASFTDWLPFYWKGYRQTTRYNYILPDIRNLDEVQKHLGSDVLRNMATATNEYNLKVKRGVSTALFLEMNRKIYNRKGKKAYQPLLLEKLIETARSREQGDIWGAFDEQGRLHAAVFIVWQKICAYCMAGGVNPEFRKSKANDLTMWEVIRFASTVSDSFDFEGSMIPGVERFNRKFGAIQVPYFEIMKGKLTLMKKCLMKLSTFFR